MSLTKKIIQILQSNNEDLIIGLTIEPLFQEYLKNKIIRDNLLNVLNHQNMSKLIDEGRFFLDDVLSTYSKPYGLPVDLLKHFADKKINSTKENLHDTWPKYLRWEAKETVEFDEKTHSLAPGKSFYDVETLFSNAQKRIKKENLEFLPISNDQFTPNI